ncbi:secreted frizzled-related protein 5-like [Pollicipes pollicipes]|uniref:secreted frizzled-related protein 5-like n=1 Tax=Pollicipes pollicipes TaxID=41117 RepID=UPI0018849F37|nr:secreted frizzled-related protein 5-like [Pollicipes pollicipes]
MWRARMLLLAPLLVAAAGAVASLDSWETVRNWSVQPVCVPIPRNMSLCRDIGYTRLRLPNLLQHDSLSELVMQSATWTPLLNLRCDPDTKLFLCSLYAPICLERPIYPCRSLCQKVELGCGARMAEYGFPWPDIVRCDKFPVDNDMCIKAQSGKKSPEKPLDDDCQACEQPETKENIMDHYCRSDVVVVAKFRRIQAGQAQCGKARLFKPQSPSRQERRALRRPSLVWNQDSACCPHVRPQAGKYLVMARRREGRLVPSLIVSWKRNKLFRSVRGLLRRFNCSDARAIQQKVLPPLAPRRPGAGRRRQRKRQSRQRRKKGGRRGPG